MSKFALMTYKGTYGNVDVSVQVATMPDTTLVDIPIVLTFERPEDPAAEHWILIHNPSVNDAFKVNFYAVDADGNLIYIDEVDLPAKALIPDVDSNPLTKEYHAFNVAGLFSFGGVAKILISATGSALSNGDVSLSAILYRGQ